ncbi:hypothetical protein [uncultured Cohaesibacter sp.]|uniref:hypothetical protein n=1 Tax=uncultured Cohaesibacter sp. TaxID=1002546 RepID=UPI002AABB56B|nr:hypothetical protein [uncultured Cohaesibacter sp.]
MGVDNWDTTPADNAVKGNVDWSEGMAPAKVNDSARQMMADLAKSFLDRFGALDTTGSAGVYTLATNTGITQLKSGLRFTFKANFPSVGGDTLNVDGKGAKKLRVVDDDGERNIEADEIDAGGFYDVIYDPDANSGAGAWILQTVALNLEIADIAGLVTALAAKLEAGDFGWGTTDTTSNIGNWGLTTAASGVYQFSTGTEGNQPARYGEFDYGSLLLLRYHANFFSRIAVRHGASVSALPALQRYNNTDGFSGWEYFFTSESLQAGAGVTITYSDGRYTIVADEVATALNSQKLGGQWGSFYRNASNLDAGTVPEARLPSSVVLKSANTLDALQNKDAGTGEYSTDGNLVSGRGSGGVALTINDGQGNANVTFNHKAGVPEQDGNSARIVHNSDATTGSKITVELASGVTSGESVNTTEVAEFSENGMKVLGSDVVTKADYGAGKGVNADLLDGQHGNYYATAAALTAAINGYESGNLTYAAGSMVSISHGLGHMPKRVEVSFVCTTADAYWAVGEEIVIGSGVSTYHPQDALGIGVVKTSTKVEVTIGSIGVAAPTENNGTGRVLAPSNFKMKVRAW